MRILCVGDVCGSVGCEFAAKVLPSLKREHNIELTVVNGENSADGNGITPQSAEHLFSIGADVITGGNHSLRRREVHHLLDENAFLLRPHNIASDYGSGYALVDLGRVRAAVINLSGQIYLDRHSLSNPFEAADALIARAERDDARIILVDFHAEATSEKQALGYYLDGRVSAVFGTHTHVRTADATVLSGGTGYITDLGMTGPAESVLGVKKEIIIDRLKNGGQQKFELADGPCMLNGCIFDVDIASGRTVGVRTVSISEVKA